MLRCFYLAQKGTPMKKLYLIPLLLILLLPTLAAAVEVKVSIDDLKRITITQLKQLQQSEQVVIVDARSPAQWLRATEKIPGAIRLASYDEIAKFKEEFPVEQAIVIYCT